MLLLDYAELSIHTWKSWLATAYVNISSSFYLLFNLKRWKAYNTMYLYLFACAVWSSQNGGKREKMEKKSDACTIFKKEYLKHLESSTPL